MENGVCAIKCCNRKLQSSYQSARSYRELCDFHQKIDENMHRLNSHGGWECLRLSSRRKEATCTRCGCPYYYYTGSLVPRLLGPEYCPNVKCVVRMGKNGNLHSIRRFEPTVEEGGDGVEDAGSYVVVAEPTKPIIKETNEDYARHVSAFGMEPNFYVNYPFKVQLMEDESYKRKGISVRKTENATYKPHANLAFDRVVSEVLNLNAAFSKFSDDKVMVDVGGSPQRNYIHSQKFSRVVYLTPTLDCSDVVREFNRTADYCINATLSEFRTAQPHFLNFTQSLYYVGMEGLFEYMVENPNCCAAFASIHPFTGIKGEIFNEAIYTTFGDDMVSMHVLETNKIYKHKRLTILFKQNGLHFERNGLWYTLAWDYHDHTKATACFIFKLKLGKYDISYVNDHVNISKRLEIVVKAHHGLNKFQVVTGGVAYPFVKEVEDEINYKARFIDRNVANFSMVTRSFLRERRELLKVYTDRTIIANCAQAFYDSASFEKDVIMTFEDKNFYSMRALSHILKDGKVFSYDFVKNYKIFSHPVLFYPLLMVKILLLYVMVTTDGSYITGLINFVCHSALFLKKLLIYVLGNLYDDVMDSDFALKHRKVNIQTSNAAMNDFDAGFWEIMMYFISALPFIMCYVYLRNPKRPVFKKIIDGMKVHWFRRNYNEIPSTFEPTLSSDTPLKFNKRGFIERLDPSRKLEKEKPLYPLLGNINGFTPNNTSGSAEFTETAINLRWVECGPSDNLNLKTWESTNKWLTKFFSSYSVLEPLNNITESMLNTWLRRFTGLKLKMLIKGLESLNITNNMTLDYAGWSSFIKREKLYKTVDGALKPRAIIHANPVYNAFFGPWFFWMYKKVKSMFTEMRLPITICSGINRSQLSEIVNNLQEKGFKHILENDFTQFEKTHTYGAYVLESNIYKLLGMPHYLVDNYVKLHSKVKAKTSKYSSFDVDFARFSGDQTTSLGNSLVNSLVTLRILVDVFGLNIEDFHLIVLGDDILIFSRVKIDMSRLEQLFSEHGFKSKLKEVNIMTATFLSMNFLKCEDGKFYAYPKIGKFVLSRSHCTSALGRDDPKSVLKSNFLSEERYVKYHPVLGRFTRSVLYSLKGMKVPKHIESEVRELGKYRLIDENDAGYNSNVDEAYFNDYMYANYGLSTDEVREMNLSLSVLGYKHQGISDPFLKRIMEVEEL